jgi:hypothetical protein
MIFVQQVKYKSQGFIYQYAILALDMVRALFFLFFYERHRHLIGQWITPYLTAIAIAVWLLALYILIAPVSTDYSYTEFQASYPFARIHCPIFNIKWHSRYLPISLLANRACNLCGTVAFSNRFMGP